VDVELAHEAGTIGVDGFGAQFQAGRDFFGPYALDQQRKHLIFAGAQQIQRIVR